MGAAASTTTGLGGSMRPLHGSTIQAGGVVALPMEPGIEWIAGAGYRLRWVGSDVPAANVCLRGV